MREPKPASASILLADELSRFHVLGNNLRASEEIEVTFLEDGTVDSAVIVKAYDILTKEELITHARDVRAGKLKEISFLFQLCCFRRKLKRDATNTIDIKLVIRGKPIDGKRTIKLRMTVRGFKDRAPELDTYSGTASRQDQRIVDSLSVMDQECDIFSLDVGKRSRRA